MIMLCERCRYRAHIRSGLDPEARVSRAPSWMPGPPNHSRLRASVVSLCGHGRRAEIYGSYRIGRGAASPIPLDDKPGRETLFDVPAFIRDATRRGAKRKPKPLKLSRTCRAAPHCATANNRRNVSRRGKYPPNGNSPPVHPRRAVSFASGRNRRLFFILQNAGATRCPFDGAWCLRRAGDAPSCTVAEPTCASGSRQPAWPYWAL